jgi:hypothetical protein
MVLKKVIPRLAATVLLVLMVSALLPAGMALAEDDPVEPQSPAFWDTSGVSPNTAMNDGTDVLHFQWHGYDWVGPADFYTFQVNVSGQPNTPIYIQYSDGAGVDNFPGIEKTLTNSVSGRTSGNDNTTGFWHPDATDEGGDGSTHDWTVPTGFAPGQYQAYVRLYTQGVTANPEAELGISFTIVQATGDLEIIKLDGDSNPLSGWNFNVTGPANMSGATGPSGNLTFEDIPIGQYMVTETLMGGWINTDPGGSAPYQKQADVPSDGTATVTFVNVEDIGGLEIFKFNDLDGDGVYDPGDGETGLDGWHFDVTGPMNMNGDTSGGGYLVFNNIATGDYDITETLQSGWANTTPITQNNVTVNLNSTTSVEFGNWEYGDIDIFKYNDLDGDGVYEPGDGETGLPNFHFNVSGAAGNPYTTDGTGHVMVEDLVPGNHTVTEKLPLPGGWSNTDPGGVAPFDKVVNVPTGDTADVEFGNMEQEYVVPTLGQWGMIALGGLLVLVMAVTIVRRRQTPIEVAGR